MAAFRLLATRTAHKKRARRRDNYALWICEGLKRASFKNSDGFMCLVITTIVLFRIASPGGLWAEGSVVGVRKE